MVPKLSDDCIKRIRYDNVTSSHLIAITGCIDDFVNVPFFKKYHKESIGFMAVCLDILSIIIMTLFFSKLNDINEEYINILDGMCV